MEEKQITTQEKLLETYDKIMHLKIFVNNSSDGELKELYVKHIQEHNDKLLNLKGESAFDLLLPNNALFTQFYSNETDDSDSDYEENEEDEEYLPKKNEEEEDGEDVEYNIIPYHIQCSAKIITDSKKQFYTGFYLYPKKNFKLVSGTEYIQPKNNESIKITFDVLDEDVPIDEHEKCVQIHSPSLIPIFVELVNEVEDLN
jgi:hypothetical protein